MLDVRLDLERLAHHALPQVLLEDRLAGLVELVALRAEVNLDDVVARVVPLGLRAREQ